MQSWWERAWTKVGVGDEQIDMKKWGEFEV